MCSPIPSPTSSIVSSTTITSSSTGTPTPTSLSNQTREFSFEGYELPNYGGNRTGVIQKVGAAQFDFNCTSYIWQPNDSLCCVTFCAVHKWGGWWCQPKQQLVRATAKQPIDSRANSSSQNASGSYDNIIIGCGSETLENSKTRC